MSMPLAHKRWCHDCDVAALAWRCWLCGQPTQVRRPAWLDSGTRDEASGVVP